MEVVDTAQINSFAPIAAQTEFVPPSEESAFILTASQLKDLIKEAIQPLQDEFMELRATVARQEEKIAALETTEVKDVDRICLDIAYDRQRLAKLESRPSTTAPPAQPRGEKTIARIAKIDEVLKSRGATTLKEMGRILKISSKEMNRLLAKLDMRRYELHARPGDAREKVIHLKVQIR
jgi:hypothetical protein